MMADVVHIPAILALPITQHYEGEAWRSRAVFMKPVLNRQAGIAQKNKIKIKKFNSDQEWWQITVLPVLGR